MTDTRPVVLKAEHLGITFGGLKAVSDFNMEIHEGELMGLIGPNGAGKTTVFNLLTGVYVPTEGAFYLCGQKLNGKQTYQVVEAGIARTFQNIRLFKAMTVLDIVKIAFTKDIHYNLADSLLRTKKYWNTEQELTAKAMHFAAQAAARQAVRVVESGGRRIPENDGRSASVSRPDPGKLTSRELADIRTRVMDGEKNSF